LAIYLTIRVQMSLQVQQKLLQLANVFGAQGYSLHCVPVGEDRNEPFAAQLSHAAKSGDLVRLEDAYRLANHLRYNV